MLIKIRPIDYYKCDKFPNVPVTKYIEYTYYDKVIKKGLFMIIDNFMFNNEKELLELRYHMLKDVVDYFVLSEGNHTYTGEPKPFYGRKYVEELGISWNDPHPLPLMEKLCWNSFRTNYPAEFIDKVLAIV